MRTSFKTGGRVVLFRLTGFVAAFVGCLFWFFVRTVINTGSRSIITGTFVTGFSIIFVVRAGFIFGYGIRRVIACGLVLRLPAIRRFVVGRTGIARPGIFVVLTSVSVRASVAIGTITGVTAIGFARIQRIIATRTGCFV